MSKQLNVADIPDYFTKTFQSSFLLQEITRKETKDGGRPFYSLRLQDASGIVYGTIWQENMADYHEALSGKVVDIKSLVTKNTDGRYHLVVREMKERQEFEIADYINGLTEEESSSYLNLLKKYINSIEETSLRELVQSIFEGIEGLEKYPATCSGHHHFSGGFLVYTVSVVCMAKYMQYSLATYNKNPSLSRHFNTDLLTAGALLHAIGTVRMVTPAPDIKRVPCTIPLTLHELTMQYIQEAVGHTGTGIAENTLCLLYHVIGCVYESDARKPILREALILKSAVELHDKITLLEHFMVKNQDKTGIVFDDVLGNYIYLGSEESDD